jgi:hypothetical protein
VLALLGRGRAALLALAAVLAANLVLGLAGVSTPWLTGLAVALAVAAGSGLAHVLRSPGAVGVALAAVPAGYLLVLAVDGAAVALSPLGPTQNSRFYGLSNLLTALLVVVVLAAVALVHAAYGRLAAALVAAVALVAVGGSRFGADGGGVIVLAAGLATLALLSAPAGRRAVAATAAAAILGVAALVAIDAGSGGSSHVTRTAASGPGGVAAALGDRAVLSWERAADRAWVAALVAAGIVALALLAARELRARGTRLAALPVAAVAATAVSLVVNDSPLEVTVAGLIGFVSLRALSVETAGLADTGGATPSARPRGPRTARALRRR